MRVPLPPSPPAAYLNWAPVLSERRIQKCGDMSDNGPGYICEDAAVMELCAWVQILLPFKDPNSRESVCCRCLQLGQGFCALLSLH